MTSLPAPVSRTSGDYHMWMEGRVRFGDLDPLGHANNNSIGNFFDDARVKLLMEMGINQIRGDVQCVMAKITLEFLAELHIFDDVRIAQRVPHIGRTSFVIHSAVFRGDQCMATGDAVCVLIDTATRKPTPVTDEMRTRLVPYA